MNPLLIAAVAGQAFSAYNSYMSLKESRKQKLEEQSLRLQEATMMADRLKTNLALTERQGRKELAANYLEFGKTGKGSAEYFASLSSRYSNMVDNLANLKSQGEYEISLRQREAALAGEQASAYNRAVLPTILGGAIQTAGSMYKVKA